jgi:putative FmdB family regulatory protein
MPIYEYRSLKKGCAYCSRGFDTLQKFSDGPLTACPKCGAAVRRSITPFAACVTGPSQDSVELQNKIDGYEKEGMWSHAAELADKSGLQERAMDNYKKAGYNF